MYRKLVVVITDALLLSLLSPSLVAFVSYCIFQYCYLAIWLLSRKCKIQESPVDSDKPARRGVM